MALKTYSGSCHCGAVRYETELDLGEGSNRCNCSSCAKVRAWFAFAKGGERFRITAGTPTEYRWTPPERPEPFLAFAFCGQCGVRMFGRGELESLGGTFHAVSVPTLDISEDEREAIPVRYLDGRNNRYDAEPANTAAF